MNLMTADRAALEALHQELLGKFEACKAKGLKLDMSRGKPSKAQLDLCQDMLTVLTKNDDLMDGKTDTRNYGGLEGILSCRQLFADMLGVPVEWVMAGGNASLTMMYDTMMRLWVFGAPNGTPWCKEEKVKWLCPAPGYDRHFTICQQLGMEMITVPMLADGPDMDMVEKLAAEDPAVKGIWCCPKYSNPDGITYSDETVRRLGAMETAAVDFRIFWDNAYIVHTFDGEGDSLLNIFDACKEFGSEDMVYEFSSTSKITFSGAGLAVLAASEENVKFLLRQMSVQTLGYDKINQLRHVKFFHNVDGIYRHMRRQSTLVKPKFDCVLGNLQREIAPRGIAQWHTPKGGYFVGFNGLPGTAARCVNLCTEAGLTLTPAGAPFPYGIDPEDKTIRIAPTYPDIPSLASAMQLFCVSYRMAALEVLLKN